ncbi:MAG: glycosyltransferase family 2 protein [Nitrospirae bacterium]|nr:MAG: glycosyltransferase family 2 protein [Nitrospirota bacterium]
MDFTVIICTYNRAGNLPRCLEALARQRGVGDRAWEVLVVDNNSTDETPAVVAELADRLPIAIRYAREPQQGLNHARNAGIRESDSRYFAYVDDDIVVCEAWLAALFDAFERNDADAVGGRIHLDPAVRLPKWIRADAGMYGFLGYQDFGPEPERLDGVRRYPFGGNMAFHRRVVERIGYFDPKFGRKGAGRRRSELYKGSETEYFHRLAATGEARIFYEPRAIVYHRVLPFQLRKGYFRTIHFNAGRQRAYHDETDFPHRLFGAPRFLYPQLLRAAGRYLWQVATRGPDWAFRQQMNVAYLAGSIVGYRRRAAERG